MRLLFDTNIVLDVLLQREPWVKPAKSLWEASDRGDLRGYLAVCTLTDIFYVARRLTGLSMARQSVEVCLAAFEICPADRSSLELALTFPGNDFEDNLQLAVAQQAALDGIVTRNPDDFADSSVPVLTPEAALQQLG